MGPVTSQSVCRRVSADARDVSTTVAAAAAVGSEYESFCDFLLMLKFSFSFALFKMLVSF